MLHIEQTRQISSESPMFITVGDVDLMAELMSPLN